MSRLLVARMQKRSRFVPLGLRDWLSRTGEMAPTTAGSSAELRSAGAISVVVASSTVIAVDP